MVIAAADDPVEINGVLWSGVKGSLAFEIGANVGRSLQRLHDRFTRVVAFEPYVPAWEIASKVVPGLDVWPLAISDHDGTVELVLTADQLQSLGHEAFNRANPEERQKVVTTLTVPCRTLDSLTQIRVPDFINMDVEGHELCVLQGARDLLGTEPPEWLIEFHSEMLHDGCVMLLESHGYKVETIRHPHYAPLSVNYYQHGWLRAFPPEVS
jgi:FkbM family methyltransferase